METKRFIVGWLVDGSGSVTQKQMCVTVEGSVITKVEKQKDNEPLHKDDIDLSYCTMLPPFVDCHAHLAFSGTMDRAFRKEQLDHALDRSVKQIEQNLHYHYSHGVLAVRDGGDKFGHVSQYKKQHSLRKSEHVILRTSGTALYKEGLYGGALGEAASEKYKFDSSSDQLKIINSSINSLTKLNTRFRPYFKEDELAHYTKTAVQNGLKVMVHANGVEPVQQAIEAGCHSIEHGYFMGKENLQRMADKGVVWVPTIYAIQSILDNMEIMDVGGDKSVIKETVAKQLEQLNYAKDLGVTVALGTDSGAPGVNHGESLPCELRLYLRAGFTMEEAVCSATHNGSELLGIKGFGLIRPGLPATFVVTRSTPAMLPRKLGHLEAMYINGNRVFSVK